MKDGKEEVESMGGNGNLGIEGVAESLGAVSISTLSKGLRKETTSKANKGSHLVRQKRGKNKKSQPTTITGSDLGKRSLVDVVIAEGTIDEIKIGEKKQKGDTVMTESGATAKVVVLDGQHHPPIMKLLSWNCQGLGNPRAVRALLRLIRVENPQIVFLMETRLKVSEMDVIRNKLGFNHCLSVDCKGSGRDRAGGLSLMWTYNEAIYVTSFSSNHIYGLCDDDESGEQWGLTGIYGYPEEHNKRKTWRLIEELTDQTAGQWLCFRDFNDILEPHDKQGGND